MKLSQETLREILERRGLDADEILSSLSSGVHFKRKSRPKLVRHYRLTDTEIQEFERQRLIQAKIRELERREISEFSIKSAMLTPLRDLVILKRKNEAIIWLIERGVSKRTPQVKRFIAQQLPKIRVRTLKPIGVMVIDLRNRTISELKTSHHKPRSISSFREPEPIRYDQFIFIRFKYLPDLKPIKMTWSEFMERRKRWARSALADKLEISRDGQRWFSLTIFG